MDAVVSLYVTSLEELLWGGLMLGLTMAIHGVCMSWTLRGLDRIQPSLERPHQFRLSMVALILLSWALVAIHLLEVLVWGAFFAEKGALPNLSTSFYFALMNYTTLGSDLSLPLRWRLLTGMLAMSGLLTFAWSTGVLFAFVQGFHVKSTAPSQKESRRA